jgi:hypothetical protein
MDETDVRSMLNALAGTEAPQARFDVGRAISAGQHGRRVRRVRAGGSVMAAVGAVVAVAFAITAGPAQRPVPVPSGPGGTCASRSASAPTASPVMTPDPEGTGSALALPPVPFDPMQPCVSFGWLPAGYTPVTMASGDYSDANAQELDIYALRKDGRAIVLNPTPPATCTQTASVVNCGWLGQPGDVPLTHPAPDVGGRPAYWAGGCGLLWEYAPDAWVVLHGGCAVQALLSTGAPSKTVRSELLRIAAGVRFNDAAPMVFPFWMDGIPKNWQVSGSRFAQQGAKRDAINLSFGPAAHPQAISVTIIPAADSRAVSANITVVCGVQPGNPQRVTVDGGKASVWTMGANTTTTQRLCAGDVDGYAVWIDVSAPGISAVGGAAGLAAKLHLLGTDPARWTKDPLR